MILRIKFIIFEIFFYFCTFYFKIAIAITTNNKYSRCFKCFITINIFRLSDFPCVNSIRFYKIFSNQSRNRYFNSYYCPGFIFANTFLEKIPKIMSMATANRNKMSTVMPATINSGPAKGISPINNISLPIFITSIYLKFVFRTSGLPR